MAQAMTLISSQTLASAVHQVTIGSIPGTYRDLRLVVVGKMATGATAEGSSLRVNSDAGSNYSRVYMTGSGTGTGSSSNTTQTRMYTESWGTSEFIIFTYDWLDYAQTDKQKSVIYRANNPAGETMAHCGRWASTSAITQIDIYGSDASAGSADNWVAGSTFYLYGISA